MKVAQISTCSPGDPYGKALSVSLKRCTRSIEFDAEDDIRYVGDDTDEVDDRDDSDTAYRK